MSDTYDEAPAVDTTTDVYLAFIDAVGEHEADQFDTYEASGPYDTPEGYAWEYLDNQIGALTVSEWARRRGLPADLANAIRFDAERYVRDAKASGTSFGTHNGRVWAFNYRYA